MTGVDFCPLPEKARKKVLSLLRIFSHPDFTVGNGIAPFHAQGMRSLAACGLYRRSGIAGSFPPGAPCPEDQLNFQLVKHNINVYIKKSKSQKQYFSGSISGKEEKKRFF